MKKRCYLYLILVLSLVSCSHLTVTREDQRPGVEKEYWQSSFILGFIPGPALPSESILCPNGRVENLNFKMKPLDVLMTVATFGLYVPHRVAVLCSSSVSKN